VQTPVALTLLLISMTFLAAWLRSYVSIRFFQVSLVDNWFCILPLVPVPRVLAEILLGLQRHPPPRRLMAHACPLGLCPETSDSAPCCLSHLRSRPCLSVPSPLPKAHPVFLRSQSSDFLHCSGCSLCTLQTDLTWTKSPISPHCLEATMTPARVLPASC
jgi:hypothetical protein